MVGRDGNDGSTDGIDFEGKICVEIDGDEMNLCVNQRTRNKKIGTATRPVVLEENCITVGFS